MKKKYKLTKIVSALCCAITPVILACNLTSCSEQIIFKEKFTSRNDVEKFLNDTKTNWKVGTAKEINNINDWNEFAISNLKIMHYVRGYMHFFIHQQQIINDLEFECNNKDGTFHVKILAENAEGILHKGEITGKFDFSKQNIYENLFFTLSEAEQIQVSDRGTIESILQNDYNTIRIGYSTSKEQDAITTLLIQDDFPNLILKTQQ